VSDGWSVWLSYRPSDFLMFSPRIYWRLFESLNRAVWPGHLAVGITALAGWGWWARGGRTHTDIAARAAAAALALCWGFVSWAFLLQRYAPINWAATAFAAAFVLQALGLLGLAATGGMQLRALGSHRRAGMGLMLWALLLHPLLAWAGGRPWQQAEVFGLAPDPTAIGTLGLLLLLQGQTAATQVRLQLLCAVPLLWCVVSAVTLWTMGSSQAWVLSAAALLACAVGLRR
jgi:hypothetical protein